MSIHALSFAKLAGLSSEEKSRALADFASTRTAPINGEVEFLDEKIRGFEQRYEMPSLKMRSAFQGGTLRETADICTWLMLLEARDGLSQQ